MDASRAHPVRRNRRRVCAAFALAILDLEAEARQAFDHRAVELVLVLLRGLLVERGREVVADVGEDLRARLDEVDVVAVALLGFVAVGLVARALGSVRDNRAENLRITGESKQPFRFELSDDAVVNQILCL